MRDHVLGDFVKMVVSRKPKRTTRVPSSAMAPPLSSLLSQIESPNFSDPKNPHLVTLRQSNDLLFSSKYSISLNKNGFSAAKSSQSKKSLVRFASRIFCGSSKDATDLNDDGEERIGAVLEDQNPNFISNRPMNSLRLSQSQFFAAPVAGSIDDAADDRIAYPQVQPRVCCNSLLGKKSLGVVTGELFLGIASRILRSSNNGFSASNCDGVSSLRKSNRNGDKIIDYRERVGIVMKDEIERVVIWEQRARDIDAEKDLQLRSSPGFSFSAAGLLFPYHLGVAKFLIDNDYIKETTPLAGSSAGAIACVAIASGVSMHEAMKATKLLAEDCRLKGTAFRIGAVLRDVLRKLLPDDIHMRCNGRVRVAVTQILWKPRGLLVDQFDSKEDLINAVFTSSFIPGYLAPKPATLFRNRLCIDGGLTLFIPPTSADKTVRVCAFPASRMGLRGIGISPDCNPGHRATPREFFNWALEPAEDHVLDRLFELGHLDAAAWAVDNPPPSV